MTEIALFATYLHNAMQAHRLTTDELEFELDRTPKSTIRSWLNGWARPRQSDLPKIAQALRRDLAEVSVGWLIDQDPSLHAPLYEDVLKPRNSPFPRPDDLAVRAVTSRDREPMSLEDPHDAERPTREH